MKQDIEKPTEGLKVQIDWNIYKKLKYLGIIHDNSNGIDVREFNVGASNYSEHIIQPWSIWLDYPELTDWDHDIVKRVLRTKKGEPRIKEYEKIIHDCNERIRQLKFQQENDI